ncbi:MAG: serine/threonine protein kinase [Planctomycetota bacterium]|nr:MAG: serine/threonine protein kinase [Planctomycetota bacterium]
MLHKDRAIHLGLRYGFLTPADIEEASKLQKNPDDVEELKDILVRQKMIDEERLIMLESVVTEEKAFGKGDILGGKYKIIRPIGAGAMAKVILAENIETGQKVALKLLPVSEKDNKHLKIRFQNEIRLHSSLRDPYIIQLYDTFLHDGRQVIAVEYIEGESLQRRLERGPLPIREALEIALQVAYGLEYLHHRDLVHRDIKPGNIFLGKDGRVKLLDLGLAKNLKEEEQLSSPGTVIGTPQYMAPEQAMGGDFVDQRADIYSLGVTLFHMITGTTPFRGSRSEIIKSHIQKLIPDTRLYRKGIPKSVRELIQKMTARKVEQRYSSIEEVIGDIKKILQQKLRLKEELLLLPHRTHLMGVLAIVLGAVAVGLLVYFRGIEGLLRWFAG